MCVCARRVCACTSCGWYIHCEYRQCPCEKTLPIYPIERVSNTLNMPTARLFTVSQPPSLNRRLSAVSHRVREFDKLPAPEMLRLRAALQCGLLFHELGEEGDRRVSEDIEHRARRALPQLPLLRAFPRLRKEVCRRHGVSYGVRSRTVRVSAEQ